MNELLTGLNGGNVPALDIVILLTAAALLPSIVIMMTSFMRIVIVLSFTRNAMGVQQAPPNMVLTGIALFLTLYIMSPVISSVNTDAYQPLYPGRDHPAGGHQPGGGSTKRIYAAQYRKVYAGSFCGNVKERGRRGRKGLSPDRCYPGLYDQ